ncbi:MAG: hypothetical protein Q7R96_04940 [Nanoarchaeota archaeon]|nr:hypothetical protein [Nanoarchaeota archaeon]
MVTTIQIQERTMEQLKQLKISTGAGTYDEVIEQLIAKSKRVPSFAGILGGPEKLPKILKELKKEKMKDDPEFYSTR